MILALVLLAITLALLAWFAKDDVREYRLFQALDASWQRRARYALWIWKQGVFFAAPSLLGLLLLGRLDALFVMPAEFAPLAKALAIDPEIGLLLLGGVLAGVIGGSLLAALLARSKRQMPQIGDIASLLPRNRAELGICALLAVSAGVTEELLFRLYLPLLLVLVTGNGWIAFGVPVLIFGLMHRYQGPVGMVVTAVIGAAMAAVYLATGSLALAMLLHVILDLNGLVLRPMLSGALRPANDAGQSGR